MRRCLLLLLLCLLVRPSAVRADEFMEHYTRGLNLYKAEQYVDALKEFEAAYARQQFPRALFNMARTYLKLGKAEEALKYFQRYKELEPTPPAAIQRMVSEGVEQSQKLLAALAKPPPASPSAAEPPTPTPAPGPAEDKPIPAPGPVTDKPASSEPPPAPPPAPVLLPPAQPRALPRPLWRVVTGGVGMGVGAGLVGLGISALSVDGQCVSAPPPMQPCQLDFDTRGIGAGLIIPGAILLGAGVVLIALPPRPARSQKDRATAP